MLCCGMAMLVCAIEAVNFSIADPNNPGQLNVAGFGANLPETIRNFGLMWFSPRKGQSARPYLSAGR